MLHEQRKTTSTIEIDAFLLSSNAKRNSNPKSNLNHHHQSSAQSGFIFIFTKSESWNPYRRRIIPVRDIERHHEVQCDKIRKGRRPTQSLWCSFSGEDDGLEKTSLNQVIHYSSLHCASYISSCLRDWCLCLLDTHCWFLDECVDVANWKLCDASLFDWKWMRKFWFASQLMISFPLTLCAWSIGFI